MSSEASSPKERGVPRGHRIARFVAPVFGTLLVLGFAEPLLATHAGASLRLTPTITLTATPSVAHPGAPVKITVTVAAPASGDPVPTGTVYFVMQNGTPLVSGESAIVLNSSHTPATASMMITGPAVGTYQVYATYSGSSAYKGAYLPTAAAHESAATFKISTTSIVNTSTTLSVFGAGTTTPISAIATGTTVTLVGTVQTVTGAPVTTGAVNFETATSHVIVASATLGPTNKVRLPEASWITGKYKLEAIYEGNVTYVGSQSPPVTMTVAPAKPTIVNTSTILSVFAAGTTTPATGISTGTTLTLVGTVVTVTGAPVTSGTVSFETATTHLIIAAATLGPTNKVRLPEASWISGKYKLEAIYEGDVTYVGSQSPPITLTVAPAKPTIVNTSTALSVFSPGTTTPIATISTGTTVTLVATVVTVTGAPVTSGTVSFETATTHVIIAAATLGPTNSVRLPEASWITGKYKLEAIYEGDVAYVGSQSPPVTLTVFTAGTTTVLVATPNPTTSGENVTLTATVTPAKLALGPATGTVIFYYGSTKLCTVIMTPSALGIAICTTTGLPTGSDALQATYGGNTKLGPSTGSTVATVLASQTTTVLTVSPSPSTTGQQVTLTATVTSTDASAGTPTGTVTFHQGTATGALLCTGTLNGGVASCKTAALPVGTTTVDAVYGGDAKHTGSSGSATATVVPSPTKTAATVSPDPAQVAQTVTLHATVTSTGASPGTPTGTVTFHQGTATGALLCTGALNGGVASCKTAALPVGTTTVVAVYGGDAKHTGSSGSATATVTASGTKTALTAAPKPSTIGQKVTLTATVTATVSASGSPTGTASFYYGTTLLCTSTLAGGIATCTTGALPIGADSVKAVYGGDTDHVGSSGTATATVVAAPTKTVATVSPKPAQVAQTVTLSATVTSTVPSAGTPTGAVTFHEGSAAGTALCTGTLSGGVASCNTAALPAGTTTVVAVYGGDSSHIGSSGSATATVVAAPTKTKATVSPKPAQAALTVTLSATVTATVGGTPTGTVAFHQGSATGTLLCTGTVSDGVASCKTAALPVGTTTVVAVYGGDAVHSSSSGNALATVASDATPPGLCATTSSPPAPGAKGCETTLLAYPTPSGSLKLPTGTSQPLTLVYSDDTPIGSGTIGPTAAIYRGTTLVAVLPVTLGTVTSTSCPASGPAPGPKPGPGPGPGGPGSQPCGQNARLLTVTIPNTLATGTYRVEVTVHDTDGDADQYVATLAVGSAAALNATPPGLCSTTSSPPAPGAKGCETTLLAYPTPSGSLKLPAGTSQQLTLVYSDDTPIGTGTIGPTAAIYEGGTFLTALAVTLGTVTSTSCPASGPAPGPKPGPGPGGPGSQPCGQNPRLLTVTIPSTLATGTYRVEVTVHDTDGDADQYVWTLTVGSGTGAGTAPGLCSATKAPAGPGQPNDCETTLLANPDPSGSVTVATGATQKLTLSYQDETPLALGTKAPTAAIYKGSTFVATLSVTITSASCSSGSGAPPGPGGNQYSDLLSITIPSTLPPGAYSVEIIVHDGDGGVDQYVWTLTVG